MLILFKLLSLVILRQRKRLLFHRSDVHREYGYLVSKYGTESADDELLRNDYETYNNSV